MTTSKVAGKVPTRIDQFTFDDHRVDVLVPDNLNAHTPVLVMHDGKNLFYSETSTFGATWGLLEALEDRAIGGPRIHGKPLIIGVWQKRDSLRLCELGLDEFFSAHPEVLDALEDDFKAMQMPEGYTPMGDAYQALIAEKILPSLADTYGIELDPSRTAIAGSSMGGLASLYAIGKYPDVYGTALSYSTHWPIGGDALIEFLVNHLPAPGKHKIWSDCGTLELDAAYPPFHAKFVEQMLAKGYRFHEDFVHAIYPFTGHNELWWAGRVEHPINFWLEG